MEQHDEQLAWERRMATPVAVCALLAGVLLVQPLFALGALREDTPRADTTPDYLLSLNEHTTGFLVSTVAQAIGALLLIPVLYYLFRATRYRSRELPEFFKWLVILGPMIYAISGVIGLLDRIDVADQFASGSPILGEAGADRADDLLESPSPAIIAFAFAGTLSLAFLYVMIPLRAMRAGLLSRFMGILGVIVGALLVLPLLPGGQAILQLFWLGAFAALVLGRWPNGRGSAWDSGEAELWPSPAQRRGLVPPADAADESAAPKQEPSGPANGAPESPVQRPSSRKRKRGGR